ncbi:MAG TPA: Holliday junction resolvase RuvX [Rhodocyclaceae bacterium]|nr:Holliday junction resolvase RuvX [Rhodocyclaceae bacterium]
MRDETLLAFDFGLRRIGVALGETRLGSARALSVIDAEANDRRFEAIRQLIAEWQPARLLVGRPLHEDGSAHEMTARCTRFANQLRGRFRLPVEEIDERYSSVAADSMLRERRVSWQKRKTQIDAAAACIILESWFASLPRHADSADSSPDFSLCAHAHTTP